MALLGLSDGVPPENQGHRTILGRIGTLHYLRDSSHNLSLQLLLLPSLCN